MLTHLIPLILAFDSRSMLGVMENPTWIPALSRKRAGMSVLKVFSQDKSLALASVFKVFVLEVVLNAGV